MNVNSIKINNVMLDGEVDLDKELPTAIEGLEVVEGLVESVTEHEAEITGLIDNENLLGAKNLLPLSLDTLKAINTGGSWSGNAYTLYGVTFTVHTDSIGNVTDITINGTATDDSIFALSVPSYTSVTNLKFITTNIAYTFSQETTSSDIRFKFDSGGAWDYPQIAGNGKVNFTFADGSKTYMPMLQVLNGASISNVTTKVMIRLASDTSNIYAPYSKSNNQLTSDTTMLVNNKELLGTKNLLPLSLSKIKELNTTGTWNNNVYTINDCTYTVNTNSFGGVTDIAFNGTIAESTNHVINLSNNVSLDSSKSYIMTGGTEKLILSARYVTEPYEFVNDFGSGVEIPFVRNRTFYANISDPGTYTNLKIYPMVRLASDTDATYRPYAMGNQELTQRLLSLEARVTALEG